MTKMVKFDGTKYRNKNWDKSVNEHCVPIKGSISENMQLVCVRLYSANSQYVGDDVTVYNVSDLVEFETNTKKVKKYLWANRSGIVSCTLRTEEEAAGIGLLIKLPNTEVEMEE